jgi:DNA-binding CsgD family transcriptional regulator
MRRLPPDDSRTPDVLRRSVAVNLRYANHTGVLALGEPLLACLDGARDADRDALEQVARAWTLSALYEHRSPYAHDADPRYRAALEQVPDATALAALGWLYGIGPKASRPAPPTDRSPADGAPAVHSRPADARPACVPPANVPAAHVPGARTPAADRATDRAAGFGPVPSPAEVRLLAAALGSHAEFERARRDLPPNALSDAALDRLRNSASYGDLAGALKAVLGDRYVEAGHSTAVQYHAMVREYLAGHWDSALSIARHIETRGRSNPAVGVGQLARALAAEIQLMRGELAHARAWLDLVPDCVAHPLVVRTRLNARFFSAHSHEAVDLAWRELREVRDSGLLAGTERVLQPIMKIGALQNNPAAMRLALTEMEALHKEMASPMAREAVFFGWGMAHRDADSALIAHRLVRQRGDVPLGVFYSQCLADLSDDPGPWLAESVRDARALGYGRPVRLEMERSARRRNLSVPRHRNAPNGLSEQDVRLIEMVSDGSTNRQIAARLTCSEKTVEQRLTRLFQRTGSRSRTELAAAWLDGSLARQGLVPETGQHGAGRAWHLVRPGGLPPPER